MKLYPCYLQFYFYWMKFSTSNIYRNVLGDSEFHENRHSYSGAKMNFCQVFIFLCVYGFVHRESMSILVQQDVTIYSSLYFCRLLYTFRMIIPPLISSTCNCNYSVWHRSNRLCYFPKGSRDGLTSARRCNYSYMCSL